ncbi:MAG: hypothetical protein ACRC5A_09245 [Enterobacteriaceae bacterium]
MQRLYANDSQVIQQKTEQIEQSLLSQPSQEPDGLTGKIWSPAEMSFLQSLSRLNQDLHTLQAEGWTLYLSDNQETYSSRATKQTVLDRRIDRSLPMFVIVLSHEMGHATYKEPADSSSKQNFINRALREEGAALLYELDTADILLKISGIDKHQQILSTPEKVRAAQAIYQNWRQQKVSETEAREKLGELYRTESPSVSEGTGGNYEKFYGEVYDQIMAQRGKTAP